MTLSKQSHDAYDENNAARFETLRLFQCYSAMPDTTSGIITDEMLRGVSPAQRQELAILHSLVAIGSDVQTLDELCERALRAMSAFVAFDGLGVGLLDERRNEIAFRLYYRRENCLRRYTLAAGCGISGQVLTSGQPRRVSNVTHEPGYVATQGDVRSELCVPLQARERTIGVLNAESIHENTFTDADECLLTVFAGQLAVAIERVRLLEAEREQRELARILAEATLALTARRDLDDVLQELLGQTKRLIPYSTANIALIQGDTLHVTRSYGYEQFEMDVSSLTQSLSDLPLDIAAIEGRAPVIVADTHREPLWKEYGTGWIRSYLAVPICLHEHVLGLLRLDSAQPDAFTLQDAQRLQPLANAAAVAIENARLHRKMLRQSQYLAQTLATSELLHRNLEPDQVLDAIVRGAVALGFRRAALSVYEAEGQRLRPRAVAGLCAEEKARFLGNVGHWADLDVVMQDRFLVSHSYLIHHGDLDWERDFRGVVSVVEGRDRGPGYWHPEDALIIPLRGSEGNPLGIISVDEPVDGLLPDMLVIQTLETFANQAAIAIENAHLYDQAQQEIAERTRAEIEQQRLIAELQQALAKVKTLSGMLPICASCKKIRNDEGYWQSVEVYIRDHSEAEFTHGLCPDCIKKLYPDLENE